MPGNPIDEMSRAIGRIDAYVHEFRHGTNNVSMKIDGLEVASAKRHDNLKIEVTSQIKQAVDAMRAEIAEVAKRVAALEAIEYRRAGATNFLSKVPNWISFVIATCSALTALYLAGRAAGIVPSPPVTPTRVEATIHPEEHRIEGVVGGKP
ncbi:MAG TPA: hypothetical protein VF637_14750 [Sphingomicrobium sp.]|jgi:hypothetical protein